MPLWSAFVSWFYRELDIIACSRSFSMLRRRVLRTWSRLSLEMRCCKYVSQWLWGPINVKAKRKHGAKHSPASFLRDGPPGTFEDIPTYLWFSKILIKLFQESKIQQLQILNPLWNGKKLPGNAIKSEYANSIAIAWIETWSLEFFSTSTFYLNWFSDICV